MAVESATSVASILGIAVEGGGSAVEGCDSVVGSGSVVEGESAVEGGEGAMEGDKNAAEGDEAVKVMAVSRETKEKFIMNRRLMYE